MTPNPALFLKPCDAIDCSSSDVANLAQQLTADDTLTTVRQCFEFVRDEIKHSSDYQLNPVTYSASEVLQHGTGYCYAKSHLLCALLRANKIPAGLCYQRLSIDGHGAPYCLHGLNAVFLPDHGWYRIDARGNRKDVDAQFNPPAEQLAFRTDLSEEYDLPEIYVSPLTVVALALKAHRTWEELGNHLPDVETNSVKPVTNSNIPARNTNGWNSRTMGP